jgi:protein phosphatase 1 regulatory subunit 7
MSEITKLKRLKISRTSLNFKNSGYVHSPSHVLDAYIQASGNKIANLRALDSQLAVLPKLETVYLEGNPCQTNDRSGYRRKIILALPQVKQIDAT